MCVNTHDIRSKWIACDASIQSNWDQLNDRPITMRGDHLLPFFMLFEHTLLLIFCFDSICLALFRCSFVAFVAVIVVDKTQVFLLVCFFAENWSQILGKHAMLLRSSNSQKRTPFHRKRIKTKQGMAINCIVISCAIIKTAIKNRMYWRRSKQKAV